MRGPLLGLILACGLCFGACGSEDDDDPDDGNAGSAGVGGGQSPDAGAAGGAGGTPVTSDPNDLHACTGPGQCTLVDAARDCCVPKCGEQDVGFFESIHVDHLSKWHEGQTCAGCLEPCDEAERLAFVQSTRTVIAVCDAGRCRPMDITESDVTSCASDAECVLRWGSSCCEDRSENRDILIAYSNRELLRELTCKDRFTACGARPAPPPDARPVCGSGGYCEAIIETPDAGSDATAVVEPDSGSSEEPDASSSTEAGSDAGP